MVEYKRTEYEMSRQMFDSIVKTGGRKAKENPFPYVLKIVNDTFGIKGTVSRIVVTD